MKGHASLLLVELEHQYTQRQKKKKPRTWTATFICLAERNQMKVPTSMEREVLFKAGLGYKKIQLCEEDKLTNESNFYQLKNIGGFELLRCDVNPTAENSVQSTARGL